MLLMLAIGATCKTNNKSMNKQTSKRRFPLSMEVPTRTATLPASARPYWKARSTKRSTSQTIASTSMDKRRRATSLIIRLHTL